MTSDRNLFNPFLQNVYETLVDSSISDHEAQRITQQIKYQSQADMVVDLIEYKLLDPRVAAEAGMNFKTLNQEIAFASLTMNKTFLTECDPDSIPDQITNKQLQCAISTALLQVNCTDSEQQLHPIRCANKYNERYELYHAANTIGYEYILLLPIGVCVLTTMYFSLKICPFHDVAIG